MGNAIMSAAILFNMALGLQAPWQVNNISFAAKLRCSQNKKLAICNHFSVTISNKAVSYMSKHEKNLKRLSATPKPADLKWDELAGILKYLGYELLKSGKSGGSRRKFYHKEKDALICCHEPHPSPDVDKGCISDVVEHLKMYKFIE